MSQSQDKKNFRWSEPVLQRHLPLSLTSEDESSSVQQSLSTSPFVTKHSEQQLTAGCCICCNDKNIKKNKFKSRMDNNRSCNNRGDETKRLKESLELQLIASQVDESLSNDRQMALVKHLDLAISTLEALLHHVQSLQMLYLSASRIYNLGHQLILPYPSNKISCTQLTDLTFHLNQAETQKEKQLRQLKEIIEICSIDITMTEQFQLIMKDHLLRREDLIIAGKNFKNLLANSKLKTSQIKKLLWQYESILNKYRNSCQNLDVELPKMIRIQIVALSQGLQMINQFYNDHDKNLTITIFKFIGDRLMDNPSKVTGHKIEQDICPKCKVNRVEKK
ncbi:uncharacterized protein LOC130665702 isoform X2 [Microplitis mediator]|uniref:uncharacterized protein LOC130665702 isoform X2 n=1 Tax=Microplitis mediator TaxID=375433 RepID=UPI002554802A|nr:uncharacterized protein LOC130665702 isoform X2 [Microplitis mediator]